MRIDLGCGAAKHPGCTGVDKLPMLGVDLVHDFDNPWPIDDNSVDFVIASNSLQYAADQERLIQEIHRVCRHGAIVCITAPYAHASVHLANPHYRQLLSEQSPRYWTPHPVCYVDPDEYHFAAEKSWSLSPNVHNDLGEYTGFPDQSNRIVPDLRLVRLEFFYFPQYEGLYEPHELSLLRQSQMNVAHHFMMHLIVIKQPIPEDEVLWLAAQPMEEPAYAATLRFPLFSGKDEPFLYPGPLNPLLTTGSEREVAGRAPAEQQAVGGSQPANNQGAGASPLRAVTDQIRGKHPSRKGNRSQNKKSTPSTKRPLKRASEKGRTKPTKSRYS
ncbi:class I SAM-dependent methyltransferase [Paenibacillus herberti]|uniref:Methyltransferase type 11 domain-containing protein n=1 Tax=Paenibacillus herberti TaxID=1619309 RepID=A0A229NVE7_9BACL|nr:class I SAM-dependent methyltransferase [Paenibacillus herberti]OXM13867.1 hypothetical protein CGZ75_12675 [Paenibacillus herberti]